MSNLPHKRFALLREAEKRGIDVLDLLREGFEAEGSIAGCARHLGVTTNSVRYWLEKENLEPEVQTFHTVKFIKNQ